MGVGDKGELHAHACGCIIVGFCDYSNQKEFPCRSKNCIKVKKPYKTWKAATSTC